MKTPHRVASGLPVASAVLAFLLTFVAPALYACSIPVFRYALERWQPDAYVVELVHHGELSGEAKAAADLLDGYVRGKEAPVNLAVRHVDAREETPARMAVYFPAGVRDREPVWSAPLTRESVEKLVDSPVRKDVVRRLLDGESAVWVLIESGDSEKDGAAAALLEKELKALEATLELPEDLVAEEGDGVLDENAPALRVAFSVVRLKRDDPAEAFLVASLLRTEPDLLGFDEPMAFPVFGRGRALYALVGRGIHEDNIAEACRFVCGACACEVKAANPGVDLLMAANWDEAVERLLSVEGPLPPLTGVFPALVSAEADKTPAGRPAQVATDSSSSRSATGLVRTVLLVLAGIVVCVIAASVVVFVGGGAWGRMKLRRRGQ
jgi:hypothetical protein